MIRPPSIDVALAVLAVVCTRAASPPHVRASRGQAHVRHRLARAGRARRLLPGASPKARTSKHGLDVTIKMGGPQVNGLQLLAAGQLDVVMADALQVLSAIEQNVPL